MSSESLEELTHSFQSRIEELQQLVLLCTSSRASTRSSEEAIERARTSVTRAEFVADSIEQSISKEEQYLKKLNAVRDELEVQRTQLRRLAEQGVPQRPDKVLREEQRQNHTVKDEPNLLLSRLDQRELDEVPAYVKGRLKLSKLNELIDEVREIVKAKYDLLSKNKRTLTAAQFRQYETYMREQPSGENRALRSFSETDLKEKAGLKFDAQMKACLGVLRATHRIKQLPGVKPVRYQVL